ncbi:Crp/Fnr family transcriptional regulator [Arsenicibacter rosenii]|uniref:Crp/Fnr family transcriptional regulator n=1 Tax=Arsenicibacter rosenii TaxID=1750698 RepID=A0A1S2VJE0_9BACT|nr:Crp/Fnr family transcriptional regulator [Arsenicibacter rosenii]OIN58326.1 Crp/Fnr family transcriptional regulator [Arsenicibacter rosenii]
MNRSLLDGLTGRFEPALIDEIARVGIYQEIEEGAYLIRPGSYIRSVPILLNGSVKIMRPDTEGREALLYYLGGLDSCAMSLTCCLEKKQSEIVAVAEEKTQLIAIPVEKVEEWICRFATWKQFVFKTYQRRFDDMIATIDSIAFQKLDERLLAYLKKKAQSCQCSVLQITHEEIANELATSREVISRLLKQMEKIGYVKLSRNKIDIL